MTKTPEQLATEFMLSVDVAKTETLFTRHKKHDEMVDIVNSHGNQRMRLQEGFLAGYRAAAFQWINVKDRLPEEKQTVLIYTDEHETYMARIYENNEAWPISNSCGCCGGEEKFTHWMPLLKPPTE